MSDLVTIGLIQASHDVDGNETVDVHKEKAIKKHVELVRDAAKKGAQIICLQEIFYGPYFCSEQNPKWYDSAEEIPNGPTTKQFQELARELSVVIVLPIYEREGIATYYNTAAVIDADGHTWVNIESSISPMWESGRKDTVSGRNIISNQEILGTRYLIRLMPR